MAKHRKRKLKTRVYVFGIVLLLLILLLAKNMKMQHTIESLDMQIQNQSAIITALQGKLTTQDLTLKTMDEDAKRVLQDMENSNQVHQATINCLVNTIESQLNKKRDGILDGGKLHITFAPDADHVAVLTSYDLVLDDESGVIDQYVSVPVGREFEWECILEQHPDIVEASVVFI